MEKKNEAGAGISEIPKIRGEKKMHRENMKLECAVLFGVNCAYRYAHFP